MLIFAPARQHRGLAQAVASDLDKALDRLTLRCPAGLVEAVGTQQRIRLEAHKRAAIQKACRCPAQPVPVHAVFDDAALPLQAVEYLVVASPKPGGVKRAQLWRDDLLQRLGRPVLRQAAGGFVRAAAGSGHPRAPCRLVAIRARLGRSAPIESGGSGSSSQVHSGVLPVFDIDQ